MSNEISGFSIVVNCFQNTNFSEDSQEKNIETFFLKRCELLSEY